MMYGVPQYIDVEDKVAGPLTAKQLGWMFAMGGVFLVLWNVLERGAFFIAAIPIALIFVGLAFYKPNGIPLPSFIGYAVSFIFSPKVYVWKRSQKLAVPKVVSPAKANQALTPDPRRRIREEALHNIHGFARLLDTEGMEKNEAAIEILRQRSLIGKEKKINNKK